MKLLLGDCLHKLKELEDNSVDSIVTDPPYGLAFMGKTWDYDVPSTDIWKECLRVLKPGGHLLSFAGSRTYHRMAVRIEDAGFEIRDQIMWIYGSGFPKSHNVGNSIDKMYGAGNRGHAISSGNQLHPTTGLARPNGDKLDKYEARTEEGKGWEGWGTALKPAHEPIVMARKPFGGTVANNVLEWGTGGINIDESRIPTSDTLGGGATNGSVLDIEGFDRPWMHDGEKMKEFSDKMKEKVEHAQTLGRFPANVILDEEAGKILDEQSGISKSSGGSGDKSMGALGKNGKYGNYALDVKAANSGGLGDVGGASRFFYCPKTSKSDRNEGLDGFDEKRKSSITSQNFENALTGSGNKRNVLFKNNHPTVKPTDLMLYLIRLVTPKGGTTLDPFMGSGSTGKGAVRGGFEFIGIEREKEYYDIAEGRINYEINKPIKPIKTKGGVSKEVEATVNKFFG